MQSLDLSGQIFGRLTAIERIEKSKTDRSKKWLCKCECGKESIVGTNLLTSGRTQSCGCLKGRPKTHGQTSNGKISQEYQVWAGMIQRCTNPNEAGFKNYGGRGISVCEAWRQFTGFFKDMGERPSGKHSIDRIDNNGNYCPENCRWATKDEQSSNRRDNRIITFNGEAKPLFLWARAIGITNTSLAERLESASFTLEEALTKKTQRNQIIEAFGKTMTQKEWSIETGIPQSTIRQRIRKHPPEIALSKAHMRKSKSE